MTIAKISQDQAPQGQNGQRYLAAGVQVALRLWENELPGDDKPATSRDYETVGYVLSGQAELHLDGQQVLLKPGDAWLVPAHAQHQYRILAPFTAVEATSPPAQYQGRDLS
ncbi:cupin domain-containing protein [Candidatus Cyanaurora vandensis]|uniref:cupin domain-containing protein n=1 Tax=Candidatus Cyanaurora vandensis TaxID=2714958 RepID=UPI00257CC932|nr:cupin domain-containing protein [Candidatus Cyanaurora vandensis]